MSKCKEQMKHIWEDIREISRPKCWIFKRYRGKKLYDPCVILAPVFLASIILLTNDIAKDNILNLLSQLSYPDPIDQRFYRLDKVPLYAKTKLSSLVKIATAADKTGPYTTFFIIRHGPTKNNHIIHGSKLDCEISTTASKKIYDFIKLGNRICFSNLYASESLRAGSTASLISKSSLYIKTWLFNEQKLGCLEGKRKDKITKRVLASLFSSPDHRMPSAKNGETAETGREVMERVLFGIFRVAEENIGKTVAICTSQCTMNWLYKYLSNNPSAIIKIKNYDIIIFKYYNETNAVELLTNDGSVSPKNACKIYESSGVAETSH
ncbi:MAG: histidine phosphatase family protein [Holosporaceae bacterium]|jgi:broad specificity phosphatase PhoE|nr:histidine phosphatase family protein [Holosporaceae bacterium]